MVNPSGDPAYALARSQEEYERLGRQAAFLHGTTARLLRDAGLSAGMRVLDVGSGAGDVALLVAGIVGPRGEVVGVDVDGAALRTAQGRTEALGLSNVRFVEGDLATAEAGDGFDAAVGRLVLMYRADPAASLRTVANRVRSGGVIAFQELDLDPAITARSLPEESLWNDTGRLVTEAFRRAGMQVRMGRQLFGAYVAAGLPEPAMCDEALVGGGPGFGGYAWLAGVVGALEPLMHKLGLDVPGELDTLADRLRDDAVGSGAVVWTPSFVGAHATKP
ncbi:class I SAM-dependent methyltransferase [Dactylosporangium sp. NBC_01737]|uniref:class I SAM-dependent methyltransferase n=1 Tax=Dactylosporangium sp. NBC_01737 TaxID=2975959 RepID=UPI002E148851|nr:class I SAM-dependent methyltransferase [Dactylosporangium sp. NBC_01737]